MEENVSSYGGILIGILVTLLSLGYFSGVIIPTTNEIAAIGVASGGYIMFLQLDRNLYYDRLSNLKECINSEQYQIESESRTTYSIKRE